MISISDAMRNTKDLKQFELLRYYAYKGSKFMYGNLPVFDKYRDDLRFPSKLIKDIQNTLDYLAQKYELNEMNREELKQWLIRGEPLTCLILLVCDVHPETSETFNKPVKLARSNNLLSIEGQLYEKIPAVSTTVILAYQDTLIN